MLLYECDKALYKNFLLMLLFKVLKGNCMVRYRCLLGLTVTPCEYLLCHVDFVPRELGLAFYSTAAESISELVRLLIFNRICECYHDDWNACCIYSLHEELNQGRHSSILSLVVCCLGVRWCR